MRKSKLACDLPWREKVREANNRTRYLFNGKELDTETNLYYYGARYFEPVTTLWYGVDPLTEIHHDYSPYTYCIANPIRYVDPLGLTEYSAEEASDPYVWHHFDTEKDGVTLDEIEIEASARVETNSKNKNNVWWNVCEFSYNNGVSPILAISEKHYTNQSEVYLRMSKFYEVFGGGQVSLKIATKYQKVARELKTGGYVLGGINLAININAFIENPSGENLYNVANSGLSMCGAFGAFASIAIDCYKAAGEYLIDFTDWLNAQGNNLTNWGNIYMFGF